MALPPPVKVSESLPEEESEAQFERLSFQADKGQEPLRIDKFLVNRIQHATRNRIQQALEEELVLVNGHPVKANYRIKPLDQVILFSLHAPDTSEIIPEAIPLDIVYEDSEVLVVNKPAGLVVHPGSGNPSGTLVNGLAYYLGKQEGMVAPGIPRFGLVHRIDKDTSGLLVVARSEKALNDLARQFFDHTVIRRYLALVWGNFELPEGSVRAHVGRHRRFRKIMDSYPEGEYGKEAVTHYKVLERFRYVTLIECRLETGRTHQIRVHMQHIHHPLFGDTSYGGDKIVKGTVYARYRQFVENCFARMPHHALHARSLGFVHPKTRKPMEFEVPLPEDFREVLEKWRNYGS